MIENTLLHEMVHLWFIRLVEVHELVDHEPHGQPDPSETTEVIVQRLPNGRFDWRVFHPGAHLVNGATEGTLATAQRAALRDAFITGRPENDPDNFS